MRISVYHAEFYLFIFIPLNILFTVCGTTGKRKACKDCSCGLAEELEAEKNQGKVKTENAKSSCGSVSI